jgi:hypothetical protein
MTRLLARFSDDDLISILIFIVLAAFACMLPAQNDTFLHLRSGMHMWQTGSFLLTEPFSHTAYGAELHNHWWLTQLVFYGVHSLGGSFLLTIFAGGCALAAVTGSWRLVKGSWDVRAVLLAWLVITTAPSWSIRPQVVSLLLLTVVLHLVARNRLWWLPLVCVVWGNAHGLVIFGVAVAGAVLLEALLWSRGDVKRAAIVLAACVAAPMISPLGWNYWPQVLATVSLARELQIQEYQMPLRPQDFPFWAGLAALIVLTILQRRRLAVLDRPERILLLGALILAGAAVMTARNVAFFAVVAAPALSRVWAGSGLLTHAGHGFGLAGRKDPPYGYATDRRPRPLAAPAWAVCFIVAAISAVMVVQRWSDPGARLGWEPVSKEALGALRECPDRLFNEMLDGGYLIWSLPSHRVFVDGRMEAYPPEVLRASRQADLFGDYEAIFRDYGINCAIVTTGTPLYSKLAGDQSMTRTFEDAGRAVFVRTRQTRIAEHR